MCFFAESYLFVGVVCSSNASSFGVFASSFVPMHLLSTFCKITSNKKWWRHSC